MTARMHGFVMYRTEDRCMYNQCKGEKDMYKELKI